jgi:hypothetical protein
MEKDGAPPDVLTKGVHHGIEIPDVNRLVILNWQVKVIDAPAFVLDRNLGQRHDRRDAVRIAFRQFFGVGKPSHPKALPYLRGAPCSLPSSQCVHWTYYKRMLTLNQEHYARWTLCIMRLWDGECSAWRSAMSVETCGFHLSSIRSFVLRRNAAADCGTGAEWMGAQKRRETRRSEASGLRSNSLVRCPLVDGSQGLIPNPRFTGLFALQIVASAVVYND